MGNLKRSYTKGHLPWLLLPVPHPHGEPLLTHTFTREPPTLEGRSGSVSCGITAPFPWILVCTRLCAFLEWSPCFPHFCEGPVIKSCWPSKSDSLGFSSPFADPLPGNPDMGLRAFMKIIPTSLVLLFSTLLRAAHLASMEFDFYQGCTSPAVLLQFYFVFRHGISFFGEFASFCW